MNNNQWTVIGLLLLLFALEAIRIPGIKTWIAGSYNAFFAQQTGK